MKKVKLNLPVKKIGENRFCLYVPRKDQDRINFYFKDVIRLKLIKENKSIEII